jgi:hypothetical protein
MGIIKASLDKTGKKLLIYIRKYESSIFRKYKQRDCQQFELIRDSVL